MVSSGPMVLLVCFTLPVMRRCRDLATAIAMEQRPYCL
jgi:hypothetical protein